MFFIISPSLTDLLLALKTISSAAGFHVRVSWIHVFIMGWNLKNSLASHYWLQSCSREGAPHTLPAARCQRRRQISSRLTLWTGLYSAGSWKYEECDLQPTSTWRRRKKRNLSALWNFPFFCFFFQGSVPRGEFWGEAIGEKINRNDVLIK